MAEQALGLSDAAGEERLLPETLAVAETEPAATAFEEAAAELDAEARRFWRRFVATIVVMTLIGGGVIGVAQHWLGSIAAVALLLFGLPAVMAVPLSILHYRRRGKRDALLASARRLAEAQDVAALPNLIGAYHIDTPAVRRLVVDGLIDLLPRVRASDRGLLSEAHQARLLGILRRRVENPLYKDVLGVFRPARGKPVTLRVAILQALEQVGDAAALPVVQALADGPARTQGEKAIREAALQCLPALQQRAEEERAHGRLLRPAAAPEAETLLRAAGGAPGGEAEVLLRAADGDAASRER